MMFGYGYEFFCYSSLENRGKLADELKRADAVVLTYACDQPATLDRLSTFWLPELRRLEVTRKYINKSLTFLSHCRTFIGCFLV